MSDTVVLLVLSAVKPAQRSGIPGRMRPPSSFTVALVMQAASSVAI
ncbi:MAG: hypothetical protein LBD79_05150 [Treponema sp.]|nr:hypothetical protein [Treponema sp.]